MNFFCTSKVVLLSPSNGQLQDAFPGLMVGSGGSVDLSARSVPRVDSKMVLRLPTAMIRQGMVQGSLDCGPAGRLFIVSRASANAMEYSPSGDSFRSLAPQYV